jgi:hypothetical protein
MKYSEAFNRLGYKLDVPRLDWSAANETGVCISLWRSEIDWPKLSIDSRVDCGPVSTWNPAGNNKRKRHLNKALSEHDGWVDVVVVDGVPGEGVDKATPWLPKERRNLRWRVLSFDPEIGHFVARAMDAVTE